MQVIQIFPTIFQLINVTKLVWTLIHNHFSITESDPDCLDYPRILPEHPII